MAPCPVTRLSHVRETARPGGGRINRPNHLACALLRSAWLLVFRRMSAPARDAFLIYPSWGLGRRCWFVRSLSFRFRFCRQITGAGPCGLFILLGRATERCGPELISGFTCTVAYRKSRPSLCGCVLTPWHHSDRARIERPCVHPCQSALAFRISLQPSVFKDQSAPGRSRDTLRSRPGAFVAAMGEYYLWVSIVAILLGKIFLLR